MCPAKVLRASVLMWPRRLCGLQPVDAQDSALSRSGTPHNFFLVDSNRPGMAGAHVPGDPRRRGSRSADPSQFVGQSLSRWPSKRQHRGRRIRAWWASVGHQNPIAYVAFGRCPVRRNKRSLSLTPHNGLRHIRTVQVSRCAADTSDRVQCTAVAFPRSSGFSLIRRFVARPGVLGQGSWQW